MAKNKYDVFISYSHKDELRAQKLAEALKSKGLNAWTSKEFLPGSKFANQMERALNQSKVFLLLLTPDFLASKWTNFEMGVALSKAATSRDTHIIPLALKPMSKQSLPTFLRSLNVINVKDISSNEAADKVVKMLESFPASS